MTDELAIMYIAVIVAITVVMVAATPLANFIESNPAIVILALGFLLMIGTTLIADGFGFYVPKAYIYAAMAFSALVEGLNMLSRRRRESRARGQDGGLRQPLNAPVGVTAEPLRRLGPLGQQDASSRYRRARSVGSDKLLAA